jgi:diadenosine tetraphosphate (Ap4A) HIT family hydrolase
MGVECEICARQREGRPHEGSVGGDVYADEYWQAYHAPSAVASPGQLFLVAKRHYLDFAEVTPEEAASYGPLLRRLYAALKRATRAQRVYAVITIEGVPHFHVWLIPRPADAPLRGRAFIMSERSCSEAEALDVVARVRQALADGTL